MPEPQPAYDPLVHPCLHAFKDGQWRADPGIFTLHQWGEMLRHEVPGRRLPQDLLDVFMKLVRHPALPVIRELACRQFGATYFAPSLWRLLCDWLCAEHGFRAEDAGQVSLDELERLLQESCGKAASAGRAGGSLMTEAEGRTLKKGDRVRWRRRGAWVIGKVSDNIEAELPGLRNATEVYCRRDGFTSTGRSFRWSRVDYLDLERVDDLVHDPGTANVFADWLEEQGEPRAAAKLRRAFPMPPA